MTFTASIYFLGQYRPAYFQADTAIKARALASNAVRLCEDHAWFRFRLSEAYKRLTDTNCVGFSAEHGTRGVSLVARPHDPFLDEVTRKLPDYPGLDYSQAINA